MVAPALVWHTLRHLTFRQIRHQVRHRLLRPGSPSPLPLAWRILAPAGREKNSPRACFDGVDRFRFNNEERRFTGDWQDPGARKLWRYNLHYMAWLFDLNNLDAAEGAREDWIQRWIRENPREGGGEGWEPYPVSLRLFNWCKHYAHSGAAPAPEVQASMALQAAWLLDRLEFHLDGNHLLENLLALAYAGFHLDPAQSSGAVRARIMSLLESELEAQFLPDGGHYELSPMYHAILLERLLDLLDAWPRDPDPYPGLKPLAEAKARSALAWLDGLTVAGRFALFNDSCYDAAPESAQLIEYGARLLGFRPAGPVPLRALPDSGYYRAEAGPITVLFDAGPLGPDHQMGHAQGDMLSFCLWLGGFPVLVPPGNYEYVPGAMRDYCRSTAAHNTVAVEGAEQAEWWASHRVGRRGRSRGAAMEADPAGAWVALQGAHDGFSRLPGAPLHRRRLELRGRSLEVFDAVEPLAGRVCRAYFHFHPDCRLETDKDIIRISTPAGPMRLSADRPLRMEEGWYCPEFGLRLKSQVAVAEFRGGTCRSRLELGP